MSTTIADALKDEMLKVLNAPEPFGIKVLIKIEKMARAGRGMLAALGGLPVSPRLQGLGMMQPDLGPDIGDAEEGGQYIGSGSLATAPYNETFGSDAIRNLVAGLPELLKIAKPTPRPADPASMVEAIERAEKNNMHELAEALKKKLMAFATEGVAVPSPTATVLVRVPEAEDMKGIAGAGIAYCVCVQPVLSGAGICGRCGGSTADALDDDADPSAGDVALPARDPRAIDTKFFVSCSACPWYANLDTEAAAQSMQGIHNSACGQYPRTVTIDAPGSKPATIGSGG